jgi:hypothetical protein
MQFEAVMQHVPSVTWTLTDQPPGTCRRGDRTDVVATVHAHLADPATGLVWSLVVRTSAHQLLELDVDDHRLVPAIGTRVRFALPAAAVAA